MSGDERSARHDRRNLRGVFQRHHAAGARERACACPWWIRYFDEYGREHHENIGPKALAVTMYRKRKTEFAERRFRPERIRVTELPTESNGGAWNRTTDLGIMRPVKGDEEPET